MSLDNHPNPELLAAVIGDFAERIIENTLRGRVVERMVARAIPGAKNMPVWHEFDIELPSGARVEVKQSAAAQSFREGEASKPIFNIKEAKGRFENDIPTALKFVADPGRKADVYVFAHHPLTKAEGANHWKEDQWRFYGIAASNLPIGAKSISLGKLKKLGAIECGLVELAATIDSVP